MILIFFIIIFFFLMSVMYVKRVEYKREDASMLPSRSELIEIIPDSLNVHLLSEVKIELADLDSHQDLDRLIYSVQQELYLVVNQLELILNQYDQEKITKESEAEDDTYYVEMAQRFTQEQRKIEQTLRYISVTERWLNQQNAAPVGRWERIQ